MSDTETDNYSETISEIETYRTTFDNSMETASQAVISAVATAMREDSVDMPSLYHAIDPDALDALFQPTRTGTRRTDRCLQFTFNGCKVTVRSYGVIVIDLLKEGET